MADVILGIDLGTTNSEVAIVRDGQPIVLTEDGDPILPSCVGLSEDGRLLVGRAAHNQWPLAPDRTIKSIKRRMGEEVKLTLGDQEYTPQEISAMILRKLRDRAARELGQDVTRAVITVPAYFNDSQRQATREAGALAGLDVARIINEPTAAALTYNPSVESAERIMVYDLGGGTFDVSIVQTEGGVREVLASHGDTHLGGDDFDELLFNHICDRFYEDHQLDLREDRATRARVLRATEEAKKALSDYAVTRIEEEFIAVKDGVDLHLNMEVTRADYEALILPLLERTMDCVQQALDDANLTGPDIDRVVLVGGSTRTPLVGEMLETLLAQPVHREVNPDLCVAMGAAIQGAIIAGTEVGAVLVDITPHSLGIKCLDGPLSAFTSPFPYRFAPIIPRLNTLPASRSELFRTVADNQATVEIEVYQGESADVRQNHQIGRFVVEGLAPVPAGNPILVQLDLNLDGILKVSAREKATGLQKQITIENALATFEREERELARERLARLWQEAEYIEGGDEFEDGEIEYMESPTIEMMPELAPGPREGQRETVHARAILEKAERLRGQVPEEDQQELDRLMGKLQTALTDRDWPVVQSTSDELADVLFYLEDT